MILISFNRKKCIGCNYCVEQAPDRWTMSKKDGKSVLIGSKENKENFTVKVHDSEALANNIAAGMCPVKIIKVHH
jgi:ferredoxin